VYYIVKSEVNSSFFIKSF